MHGEGGARGAECSVESRLAESATKRTWVSEKRGIRTLYGPAPVKASL